MPEKTKQSPPAKPSVEVTRVSDEDELQSAKILFQEGLFEEAKKKLYQLLILVPNYKPATDLLKQIQDQELKGLLSHSVPSGRPKKSALEDPEKIIQKLNADLNLGLTLNEFDPEQENWIIHADLDAKAHYDLGVAFFEMGCYRDAVRELKSSEKQIRMQQSFLGEDGVAVTALYCECLILLGRAYEAKAHLEPILTEPDLNSEAKNVLFYVMGMIEQSLGRLADARGWFQKVFAFHPDFREVRAKLKQLP